MMAKRLNKYIADAGICSRREADRLIAAGQVTVNGGRAALGAIIGPDDKVAVNGEAVAAAEPERTVLAFYKPVGVTCTERDRHAALMVKDVLRHPVRLTYAGRLDRDSEGLLLMTNDGLLIEKMMRGRHGHEKEYAVKVDRDLTAGMMEKMAGGVFLPGLGITTRPCSVAMLGKREFSIILTQGVNRQIRRMAAACGVSVVGLKRVRVANIELGDLHPGGHRAVEGEELKKLYGMCGLAVPVTVTVTSLPSTVHSASRRPPGLNN